MLQSVFQHLISWYMGLLAQCRFRPFKNWAIKRLIRKYKVDTSVILEADVEKYEHFNAFFTRALKPESRPIAPSPLAIASPADGFISQIGAVSAGKIIQAKNANYTVDDLLGCDAKDYGFEHGQFVNIYLSPNDYHRVHIPITGRLEKMIYIPGNLFSVNPLYVEKIPNLFTRNERIVALFETKIGWMALALVGAMVVGKIEMVWEQKITHFNTRKIKIWNYADQNLVFKKGQEIGRFLLGSTVIAIFPEHKTTWYPHIQPGNAIKMGQSLGAIKID